MSLTRNSLAVFMIILTRSSESIYNPVRFTGMIVFIMVIERIEFDFNIRSLFAFTRKGMTVLWPGIYANDVQIYIFDA